MTEKMIDAELLALLKRPPRTTAEHKFYAWLKDWKDRIEATRELETL